MDNTSNTKNYVAHGGGEWLTYRHKPGKKTSGTISLNSLGAIMKLTKEQFERECDYRLAMSVMKTLLRDGILTKEDYRKAEKCLIERLNPVWGQLPRLAV